MNNDQAQDLMQKPPCSEKFQASNLTEFSAQSASL